MHLHTCKRIVKGYTYSYSHVHAKPHRCAHTSPQVSAGIFPPWTNQTQEAQVYSHDGPIRCKKHRYILRSIKLRSAAIEVSAGVLTFRPMCYAYVMRVGDRMIDGCGSDRGVVTSPPAGVQGEDG
eukprot:8002567-Pyramimonas_sp.AAC.1